MDQMGFEKANELWKAGHNEEAAQEFLKIGAASTHSDEKAAALINGHKCYVQVGKLNEAEKIMRQIRSLPIQDNFVRLIVDFGDACMTTQMGNLKEGIIKFEGVLRRNQRELEDPEWRCTYEELQERRAFALVGLKRSAEALPILKEAVSFKTEQAEPQLVYFYLGICYSELSEIDLAKQAYLKAISFALHDNIEADAHYRLGVLYFVGRAFAQAKFHLESALQLPEPALGTNLRKYIYQQLSRTCHYLGQKEEEKKYSAFARK